MKISLSNQQAFTVTVLSLMLATGDAFTSSPLAPSPATFMASRSTFAMRAPPMNSKAFRLQASHISAPDDEVARLQSMAAKLRAEAASLEAEQQKAFTQAAEKAFAKFDTNGDGQVGLQELKDALEKTFKLELPEKRVEKLMAKLDTNGDGVLQMEEFANVDQLRNQLDAIAREDRAMVRETQKKEAEEEQAAELLAAQLELINDREPTGTDKLVSVLPYLFPLLDGLQYARFLVLDNPENPIALATAAIYGLYRAIPFGGFLAFFALSFLSGNPQINRLVRYNMQQAIYLDIALIIPGLIFGAVSLIGGGADGGNAIAQTIQSLGSDGVLVALLAVLGYTSVSSLLGSEPNKIPFISDATNERMPTIDMIMDAQRQFSARDDEEKKD